MSESEAAFLPTTDLLLLKRRQLALRRKQLELARKFGLVYYRPHPKQDAFHRNADFRFRLLRSGNRFGKSDCGVSEDLAFALGERPWYPKGDPARFVGIPEHSTKGLVIAADSDKVDEIFTGDGSRGHIGKIWKKIPKDLIIGTPKKNSAGTIVSIRIKSLHGESVIDFDTRAAFKTNPMGAESSDYDWVHVDEPIEEAHWKAVFRGLTDRGGKAWFTCTLIEQPWINDFFFPSIEAQREDSYIEVRNGRKLRWVITGSMFDNPYLTEDDINDYLETLTEDEKQCRIHGIPLHLSGLVHKAFDYSKHVLTSLPLGWQDYHLPPKDYTISWALDPHPRTPSAVLFCAVSPQGRRYYYDEIYDVLNNEKLAQEILRRTQGYFVWTKLSDPSAWIKDERFQTVQIDDLERFGLYGIEKGSKDLSRCIRVCNYNLEQPDTMYFSPNLRRFLWEINRYSWANDPKGTPLDKPVDKDDHMIENWHRLELDGPIYIDRAKHAPPVDYVEIDGDLSLDMVETF